VWVSG